MLTELEKQWIIATCAPESIHRVKETEHSILYLIHDEAKTNKVWVLSSELRVIGLGRNADELAHSTTYSIKDGITKISELLGLSGIRLE